MGRDSQLELSLRYGAKLRVDRPLIGCISGELLRLVLCSDGLIRYKLQMLWFLELFANFSLMKLCDLSLR